MLEVWAQQLVNALTIGGMYTLVAVGFTLFFGVLRLINFAHGEVFMLGGFAGLVVGWGAQAVGVTNGLIVIFMMLVVAMGVCAVIGALMERFAYRPVRGMPVLIMLVTSLAVGIVVREAVKEFFPEGANPHAFFSPFEYQSITIGTVVLDYTQMGLIVSSLVIVYGVHLLVAKTWAGRAMRAISEDLDAARMMGVEVDSVIRNTFFLGSALGGVAGVMNGLYYLSIRFDMGWVMGIKGFTAAIVGGLGNVYGAMIGGYVVAFVEVLVVALIPEGSRYKDVFVFLLLILVLVFRPSGILKAPAQKAG
ncbi:MAG: branched-chain amino acid ABC transporter permease [Alphaproteobacteria bacterium]|nr:branched-chain amino acid ABC transporter permease [Alphaproteobacteria bacterium]